MILDPQGILNIGKILVRTINACDIIVGFSLISSGPPPPPPQAYILGGLFPEGLFYRLILAKISSNSSFWI